MRITFICTLEPATGKHMMRPACELYRTREQAERNVMRREYVSGIPTWLKTMAGLRLDRTHVTAIDEYF